MAIEVDPSRYPKTVEASLRGESRKQQGHFIDTFLAEATKIKGLREVFAHFDPKLLRVITSMDTRSEKNWDGLSDLEWKTAQEFSGVVVLFEEVDLDYDGEERLEDTLPEGSVLVYPIPKETSQQV